MRATLTAVFILIILHNGYAQTKYFVNFKDKGIPQNTKLMKSSSLFQLAEKELSQRAIERRMLVMGDDYITYEDIPINENYISEIEKLGVKIIHKLKWFNAITAYLSEEQISQLKNLEFIQKIEKVKLFKSKPDYINPQHIEYQLQNTNTLLDYGQSFTQNNLSEIPVVHDLGINGSDVIIGLLDTGFRWKTHPALQNKTVLDEWDFIQQDNVTANETSKGDRSDQDAHGTAVFSIIGGFAPGNLIGPAFDAKYILAKTEYVPTETHVEEDNYEAALQWMEAKGVDITSSSLGYSEFDVGQLSYTYQDMNGNTTKVAKAANFAFERGVSTFTAAGNEGSNYWGQGVGGLISPGDAFNMLTIGAVDLNNNVVSFSSRGPTSDGRIKPEVVAMGSGVYHAFASGTYGSGGGTSYATPIAAGIAGLLKSTFTHLNNRQIRQIIIEAGDNTSAPNNERGYGLLSAKRAITFPNLKNINNTYRVNKIFSSFKNVKTNSTQIFYKVGNGNFQSSQMTQDGEYKFYFDFPIQSNDIEISFYFVYDNNSLSVREPGNGEYKFKYGSLITYYNLATSVDDESIPNDFNLMQNYPNPFNPSTTIRYSVPANVKGEMVKVTLKVYDILGREVAILVDEYKTPGIYNCELRMEDGELPSGVYLYTLKAGTYINTMKMLLLK